MVKILIFEGVSNAFLEKLAAKIKEAKRDNSVILLSEEPKIIEV